MLCNYGYDVKRCFDCRYGDASHVPDDYEGWSDTVIKDTMVTWQLVSCRSPVCLFVGPSLALVVCKGLYLLLSQVL